MNYQNLPVRNKEAKNVKRIMKARKGWVLLGADLSAAEMRWACICSMDKKLQEIFNSGVDIHGAIAKEVFGLGCHPNEVKKLYPELRDIAKTIQFLSLYGGGASTLASKVKIKPSRARQILEEYKTAEELVDKFQFSLEKATAVLNAPAKDRVAALMTAFTITEGRAQDILDEYFAKYPGVAAFIRDTSDYVAANGFSLSLLGRKRRVPGATAEDSGSVQRAIRQAVNSTIQSIASDGLMSSLCDFQDYLDDHPELPILILGPIHDAAYLEVRRDYVEVAKELLIKFMCRFPEGIESPIPMVADAEFGEDWAHFEEFGETLAVAADIEEEDEEEEAA